METDAQEEGNGSYHDPYAPPKGRTLAEFLPPYLKGKDTTREGTGRNNKMSLRETGYRCKAQSTRSNSSPPRRGVERVNYVPVAAHGNIKRTRQYATTRGGGGKHTCEGAADWREDRVAER